MSLVDLLFYLFIFLTAASALGILLMKNVLHAALFLMTCLLSLAGVYVLLQAEFLAVTQIIIYAGGVLILIIFGIVLSTRVKGKPLNVETSRLLPGILTGTGIFSILIYSWQSILSSLSASSQQANSIKDIGYHLMSNYVAPFELAGLLLLISLIAAGFTASFLIKRKTHAN